MALSTASSSALVFRHKDRAPASPSSLGLVFGHIESEILQGDGGHDEIAFVIFSLETWKAALDLELVHTGLIVGSFEDL